MANKTTLVKEAATIKHIQQIAQLGALLQILVSQLQLCAMHPFYKCYTLPKKIFILMRLAFYGFLKKP